mmetsp:Transcript_9942/g.13839  ORF Transcript_9942/g.13839 Transcript_9942/m.13839 type:complete len:458 (-) Transcript_9942:147-1520(-)|eukprot:CAMPEP_0184479758 /NCGR_PEP_ID=MMETSP0113_2-20130426/1353_1 /TAXON_ID=91329 /ORGANISM="Norrisiella sphaerica, Strain BC52" /LENGTH=457 /DNA_ID=CAMNT_0026857901 /DNA_START=87 /DNA_END=1460 /DNA_ORIENTATION=-
MRHGKAVSVAILAIIVVTHYKLMQVIQTRFKAQYTLFAFTAAIGILPLLMVRLVDSFERERRKRSHQQQPKPTNKSLNSEQRPRMHVFSAHTTLEPNDSKVGERPSFESNSPNVVDSPLLRNFSLEEEKTSEGEGAAQNNFMTAKDTVNAIQGEGRCACFRSDAGPGERYAWSAYLIPASVLRVAPPAMLLKRAVFIGTFNTMGFFASMVAVTHAPLWISMTLIKVDSAFNLVLSVLFLAERATLAKIVGSSLALIGAALLSMSDYIGRSHGEDDTGEKEKLVGAIAAICYALILSFLMTGWKAFLQDFSWALLFTLNGLASFVQVILFLPVFVWAVASNAEGPHTQLGEELGFCIINAFLSLALAMWWTFCIGYTSPTYVAVAGVAVVPLTLLLDYLTDNIHLHWLDGVATMVILSGFFLTKRGYDAEESQTLSDDEPGNHLDSYSPVGPDVSSQA